MNNFKLLFFIAFILISNLISAQDGYNIQIKIKDFDSPKLYLGYHFGNRKFIIDTATVNKGIYTFARPEKLEGGIYLVILPSKKFFEIIIDKDQDFFIESDTTDFIMNMKVKDSEENTRFNDYQKKMRIEQLKMYDLRVRGNNNLENKDSLAILENELKKSENTIKQLWKTESENNKGTLLGKFIDAMMDTEFPEGFVPKDSLEAVNYYKKHFFDNVDFNDERMLKSPILYNRIHKFLENYLDYHPDTVVALLNHVIPQMKKNEKVYKYLLMQILNHFESNNVFGFDEVFIYIAEKYFINDADYWHEPYYLGKIQERVNVKKRVITGQIAPDLKMFTQNDESYSLYDVQAKMTILMFWSPDCGHCQLVTPEIVSIYNKYKDKNIKIFAVLTEGKKEEWIKYTEEKGMTDWLNVYDPNYTTKFKEVYDIMGTPIIFLLDENKRIIAKKINPPTLERLINIFLK